jgi:hypothetical protein
MKGPFAAVALVLALTEPAHAKLEIRDVRAVQGMYGPERPSLEFYPGDEVFFRYVVTGFRTDAADRVDLAFTIKLIDAAGKPLLDQTTRQREVVVLGGDSFPAFANLIPGEKASPGVYRLKVTVRDNLSGEIAFFQRKLACKEPAFAIIKPRFSYDPAGKVPAPVGGLLGQTLHFRMDVIGYDRSGGKIRTRMEVRILDSKGRELMGKPLVARVASENKDEVTKATSLTFRGRFGLTRVGTFRVRITIFDEQGKQKTEFDAPLRVTSP